jgi:hypothetical protein
MTTFNYCVVRLGETVSPLIALEEAKDLATGEGLAIAKYHPNGNFVRWLWACENYQDFDDD